jgi:hypothetical protein
LAGYQPGDGDGEALAQLGGDENEQMHAFALGPGSLARLNPHKRDGGRVSAQPCLKAIAEERVSVRGVQLSWMRRVDPVDGDHDRGRQPKVGGEPPGLVKLARLSQADAAMPDAPPGLMPPNGLNI